MARKHWQIAILGMAALMVILYPATPLQAAAKDTLNFVMGAEPVSLDPPNQTDTPSITALRHVYDLPIHPNVKGDLVPGLFTTWENSADGKTWKFTLRKGVKFHDGTPFNAEAVKYNWERCLSTEKRVIRRSFFTPWARNIKIIDDYTIQTTSAEPFAPILRFLTHGAMAVVSPAALKKYGDEINRNAVGTGPFRFVEWLPGNRMVMERNEEFWGEKPKFKKLIMRFVKESSARVMMLETGEADIALKIPPVDIERLKKLPAIEVLLNPINRGHGFTINVSAPLVNNLKFRQALAYAIDKNAIITHILKGLAKPLCSVIGGGTFGESTPPCYEYNPEKAKQLLKEAGYNGEKLEIWTPQGRYMMDRETSEAVQSYWTQVGINAEVRVMEFATIERAQRLPTDKAKYQILFIGFGPVTADGDQILRARYHSKELPPDGANISHYKNPEYDKVVEAQAVEMNTEKRLALLKKCQEILAQDLPFIPIHIINDAVGISKKLKNVEVLPIETTLVREAYFQE